MIWAVVVLSSVLLAWADTLMIALVPWIVTHASAGADAIDILDTVPAILGALHVAFVMFAGIITATTPTRRAVAFAIMLFSIAMSVVNTVVVDGSLGLLLPGAMTILAVWLVSSNAPPSAWFGLLVPAVGSPLLSFPLAFASLEWSVVLWGHIEALCLIAGFLVSLAIWLRPTVPLRTYLLHGAEYEQRRRQVAGEESTWANATPPSAATHTNTMAVLALVFGIVCAPVGAVLGLLALAQIQKTGERGRGLALAGLAIACLLLGTISQGSLSYLPYLA
ncbi:hypothetical protein HNR16_002284 [Pseudoclavibacter chungangensis]|uniref:DUF4190 domain-containing protein n=1 Tax=Pseudoclavibacter chungangensis TaxID=587635 RepID=UPI0017EAB832|nr:DUF4190 domain-containing protein [Pseudoclavibacter chungangensis]NYJ67496.1 hypothetical protein [Pseudoclavibacter chungangensis]